MLRQRIENRPLTEALEGTVRVYEADRETLADKVPVKKAITMIHRGVADIIDCDERFLIGDWPKPISIATSIVGLSEIIDWARYHRTGAVTYSRDALRIRDRGICAYCGHLCWGEGTVDHVVPKAHGGKSEWLNVIWACRRCNETKRDRTPEQAAMPILHGALYAPTFLDIHDPKKGAP